jgi:hypothetical protein
MKLRSKDGIEMMDVKSIAQEGNRLVVKVKMMGTMATIIHVEPEDLWAAFRLLSPATILRLPVLLWKGRTRARRNGSDK